jgi:hypothetical protein
MINTMKPMEMEMGSFEVKTIAKKKKIKSKFHKIDSILQSASMDVRDYEPFDFSSKLG